MIYKEEEEYKDSIVVPKERLGVFIGKKGETKKKLEKVLNIRISIDKENNEVTYSFQDPSDYFKIKNIMTAIARGFTPEEALELIDENKTLYIIDLRDWYGKNKKTITRYKGRVIGEKGMARKRLEEYTDTNIVIYGKTISIIGRHEDVEIAREAIEMLLKGSNHSTVFNFVERRLGERNLMK